MSSGRSGDRFRRDRPTQVSGLDAWAAIAAGDEYSLAVRRDGSLWVWGMNDEDRLGLRDALDRLRPTLVEGDSDWTVAAAGSFAPCAVKRDGSLWSPGSWGYGWWDVDSDDGFLEVMRELGIDLPTGLPSIPESAAPGGSVGHWATVVLGATHAVGLKSDRSLWTWGTNEHGQLGLGDLGERSLPTRVGVDGGWASIAAGRNHSVALKRDGSLWVWGLNDAGQLGLGDHDQRDRPMRLGLETEWAAVAAGGAHTLALKRDGTLWAWGASECGQLGRRHREDLALPMRCDDARDWESVAAGSDRSLALKLDGTLWAWGDNSRGELGLGDAKSSFSPRPIGGRGWASVAVGLDHTLALKRDGTLWAWGGNGHGQLGVCDSDRVRSARVRPIARPMSGTNRIASSDRPSSLGLLHPVSGRLPLGSVPHVVPYQVAEIELAEPVPNLASVPAFQLAEWLVAVVDVEGPIHVHEAARRIAHAVGVKRVGNLIDRAFRAAALEASYSRSLVQFGDFLWNPDCTEMVIRDRSASPPWVRKTELLADEEIEWAVCSVLLSHGCVDEGSLPRLVMKALGFGRTRRDAEQRVRDAVSRGIEAGAFVRLGPGVVLVGPDGDPAPPRPRSSAVEAESSPPAGQSPPARSRDGMPNGTQRILTAVHDAEVQARAALLMCLPSDRPTPWLIAAAQACVAAGADMLEFQASASHNPAEVVAAVGAVAGEVDVPCLLMPDLDIVRDCLLTEAKAWRLVAACADAGIAGIAVPTKASHVPFLADAFHEDVARIAFVSPNMTEPELEIVCGHGLAFAYAVGISSSPPTDPVVFEDVAGFLERVRRVSGAPVFVGARVQTPAQAALIATFADGVAVLTAVVRTLGQADQSGQDSIAALASLVRDLRQAVVRGALPTSDERPAS